MNQTKYRTFIGLMRKVCTGTDGQGIPHMDQDQLKICQDFLQDCEEHAMLDGLNYLLTTKQLPIWRYTGLFYWIFGHNLPVWFHLLMHSSVLYSTSMYEKKYFEYKSFEEAMINFMITWKNNIDYINFKIALEQ